MYMRWGVISIVVAVMVIMENVDLRRTAARVGMV